jgi:primosomal protein N' (replication factor Y)
VVHAIFFWKRNYYFRKDSDVVVSELSDDEYLIFDALQQQSSLKVQDIMSILNKKKYFSNSSEINKQRTYFIKWGNGWRIQAKLIRYIRLQEEYSSNESLMQLLKLWKP